MAGVSANSGASNNDENWSGFEGDFDDDGGSGVMSEINVTPLVDVMLVLLVIFMVTTPLLEQGIEIHLPKATAAPLKVKTEKVVLDIDAKGQLFFEKTQLPLEGLEKKLRAIFANREDKQAYVKADEDLPYGKLAKMIARLKKAGVEKVGLVTLQE